MEKKRGEVEKFEMTRLYTVREVAEYFKVSERTVYGWIEMGYLRAIKVGSLDGKGTVRVPEDALEEFIRNCQTIPIRPKRIVLKIRREEHSS
jgi:excisionase family DNA binding protein